MTKLFLWIALVSVGVAAATLAVMHFPRAQVTVQRSVIPGKLSQPHAFLENKCAACHTPIRASRRRTALFATQITNGCCNDSQPHFMPVSKTAPCVISNIRAPWRD